MPEDIKNTQTGGEGVTTQEGSKKAESKTIETPKAKPVEQTTKEPAETKEPEVTKAPDKAVSDAPAPKGPDVDVDLIKEDLKQEDNYDVMLNLIFLKSLRSLKPHKFISRFLEKTTQYSMKTT
jgi:hypothetical protein